MIFYKCKEKGANKMKYFTNDVGSNLMVEWSKEKFYDLLFSYCSSYNEYHSYLKELEKSNSHSVVIDNKVFIVDYEKN